MKRVINGKAYDTNTAELIAAASYGYSGDFHAWEESLYKTKAGRFFIYGVAARERNGAARYHKTPGAAATALRLYHQTMRSNGVNDTR